MIFKLIDFNEYSNLFILHDLLDHLLAFSCVKVFNIMGFYPANVLYQRFKYIPYLSMYSFLIIFSDSSVFMGVFTFLP